MKKFTVLLFSVLFSAILGINASVRADWVGKLSKVISLFPSKEIFMEKFNEAIKSNDLKFLISIRELFNGVIECKNEIISFIQQATEEQISEACRSTFLKAIEDLNSNVAIIDGEILRIRSISILENIDKSEKSNLMDDQGDRPCCKMCSVQALMNAKFGSRCRLSLEDIFVLCYDDFPHGDSDVRWNSGYNNVIAIGNEVLKRGNLFEKYRMCTRFYAFGTLDGSAIDVEDAKQKTFRILKDNFNDHSPFAIDFSGHSAIVSGVDETNNTVTIETYGRSSVLDFDDFFDILLYPNKEMRKGYGDSKFGFGLYFVGNRQNDIACVSEGYCGEHHVINEMADIEDEVFDKNSVRTE